MPQESCRVVIGNFAKKVQLTSPKLWLFLKIENQRRYMVSFPFIGKFCVMEGRMMKYKDNFKEI